MAKNTSAVQGLMLITRDELEYALQCTRLWTRLGPVETRAQRVYVLYSAEAADELWRAIEERRQESFRCEICGMSHES